MTDYRHQVCALIDPEQTEGMADGTTLQHVSVILTDDPPAESDGRWLAPAAITLRPRDARQLAGELLALADRADTVSGRRR